MFGIQIHILNKIKNLNFLQDYETRYAPVKRENKGEFGLIISDYKKKLQAIQNKGTYTQPLIFNLFVPTLFYVLNWIHKTLVPT